MNISAFALWRDMPVENADDLDPVHSPESDFEGADDDFDITSWCTNTCVVGEFRVYHW